MGFFSQNGEKNFFIEVIKTVFGDITTEFKETLDDLIKPFYNAFSSVLNAVKSIKSGYSNVRDM